ncbi:MAG TPA: iron ABC transporter substrate-binding protein [Trueperaceae bacterium]|nr:iron ABC transporter substrate-binding protein [Trueperaceae bacterium]
MSQRLVTVLIAMLLASVAAAQSITLYVGRGESLAGPIIERFTEATGIEVEVRYGSTAELAVLISEEGAASPADGFWAQDAGALGALAASGSLAAVPAELVANVAEKQVHPDNEWVAVSARNRTLIYSTERVSADELPASVLDLTDGRYANRVAWAPSNGSFQSFVTALRVTHGEDVAEQWLRDMIANGAKAYPNNGSQLDAVAAGEVDFGLVNNYYLMRRLAEDPDFPVAQTFFDDGDIGNLANVTGIGVVAASDEKELVHQFIDFLLSDEAQSFFTNENFEYPITESVEPADGLASSTEVAAASPLVDLTAIDDLQGTLELLREVGLL